MVGYKEVIYFAWDIESRSYITMHSCAKLDKNRSRVNKEKTALCHNMINSVLRFVKDFCHA